MWHRCAQALAGAKLDRPEWNTILDRQRHRAEVIAAVTAVTEALTSDEVMARLGAAKVNVAKVNNIGQAADHPQLASVGAVIEFDMSGRPVKAVSSPFALNGVPPAPDRAPPALGEHTDAVLTELGVPADEIAALRAAGAFGTRVPEAVAAEASPNP